MSTQLTASALYTETETIDHPVITVEDGLILSVEAGDPNDSPETLTAAFFDIHVHGAVSFDFMTATPAEITAAGRFLALHGVAHYLPTTVTGPIDVTLRALETLADAIEAGVPVDAAMPVGIHLEGPFVSHAKRGVHPVASLQSPSLELFERFRQAARGHIRLVTLAPELPGAIELIEYATAAGVRVSLGHSDATAAETTAGIAAGATSATHTFNAMRSLGHREPGILGVVLDRDDLYAELICDGVHVDPAMVRLWQRMKGPERAILVTDGMSASGMGDGEYASAGRARCWLAAC
jgi:N-acetylglucosamine-6-phosphate deacetylase